MQDQPVRSKPFLFFFLVLPYGISIGFVSVALPFVLVREGFSVATAASVVALGLAANLGTASILWMEAVAGIACVLLGLLALRWLRGRPMLVRQEAEFI